ncbi:hypothetical protein UFOVP150_7 [uncultured Caudovirales phage]|uniref:Tail tube protein n=1 Tax=uncultured Caudovirales phage TaxID=2100421 RepID=A0A6J7W6J5_9CAUD|nr:hypothetical protein UFOVP150_7 [uncultured Caudovirales phage]
MADTTITAANSVFTITAASAGIVGVQLFGYSTDRGFFTDANQLAEIQMGVDGYMTAGYTPTPQVMHVTLMADSPSKAVFKAVEQTMRSTREVIYLSAEIALPSTAEKYTMVRGILTQTKTMPDAAKVLQPVEYTITWQSITASVL